MELNRLLISSGVALEPSPLAKWERMLLVYMAPQMASPTLVLSIPMITINAVICAVSRWGALMVAAT
jgi:hypothetical protein